jgi:hypothetical protein
MFNILTEYETNCRNVLLMNVPWRKQETLKVIPSRMRSPASCLSIKENRETEVVAFGLTMVGRPCMTVGRPCMTVSDRAYKISDMELFVCWYCDCGLAYSVFGIEGREVV